MLRVALICHAATEATRRACFPADEPLTGKARRRAEAVGWPLATDARCVTSPALRARQTTAAIGLDAAVEPALGDCDYGRWTGLSLDEASAADPAGVELWLGDPAAAPHGGESLAALATRVEAWLAAQPGRDGPTTLVAVTHAAVIKAAIVHALAAPACAFWRIDVAPLSVTRLRHSGNAWTLASVNQPLDRARSD